MIFSANTEYGEIQQIVNSSDRIYALTYRRALLESTDYQHWNLTSEDVLAAFSDYSGLFENRGILVTSDNDVLLSFANSTHSLILFGRPPNNFVPIIASNNSVLKTFEYDGLGGLAETKNHTLLLGVYGEANSGLVYKSTDNGTSWNVCLNATQFLIDQGAHIQTIARHIHDLFYDQDQDRVVAIVGEATGDSFSESIIYSDDLGATWKIVEFRDYSFLGMEGMTCGAKVHGNYVIGDDMSGKTFISIYNQDFKYVNTLWEFDNNFVGQNFMDGKTFGNISYFPGEGNHNFNALYVTDGVRLGRILESDSCWFYTISCFGGTVGLTALNWRTGDFLLAIFTELNQTAGLKSLNYPTINSNSEAIIAPEAYVNNIQISFKDYADNFLLIEEDDFEYSSYYSFLQNWTDNSATKMNLNNSYAYNGSQSLQYSSSSSSEPSRFIQGRNWVPVNLSAGTRMIVGFAIKVDNYNTTSDYTAVAYFDFNYTNGKTQSAYARWHVNTNGWLLVSEEYDLAKDVNAVRISQIFGQSNQKFNIDCIFIGYLQSNVSSRLNANFFTGLSESTYATINGTSFPIIDGEVNLVLHDFVSCISVSTPKFGMFEISYVYNVTTSTPLSMRFVDSINSTIFSVYYDTYPSQILINVSISGGLGPYNANLFYNGAKLTMVQTLTGNFTYVWVVPKEWIGSKFTAIITGSVTDLTGNIASAEPYLVVDPPVGSVGALNFSDAMINAFLSIALVLALCASGFYCLKSRRNAHIDKTGN
jgi:hypothetical protein